MAHSRKFKRRTYIIDREFQFRYMLTWMLLTLSLLGGMVLTSLTLFFLFRQSLLNYFIQINAGCAAVITGLSLYYMVHHSHRIAGPAYRIERTIRAIARGHYDLDKKVYLRRKDYLQHLATALNELIDRRAIERDNIAILVAGISQLDQALRISQADPELVELSGRMLDEVSELAGSPQTPAGQVPVPVA